MKVSRTILVLRSLIVFAALAAFTPPLGGQQAYHGQVPVKTAGGSSSAGRVYHQEEVGAVMVSMTAFPWEDVADQMNANITRTTDQAINDVQGISAAATQSDVAAASLQLMLSYGLGGAGGNSTSGNSSASGASANTTGSLPNLGTLPALPTNLGVDPRLTYEQATGLMQWLAALNRRVQLVSKEHYDAYLVNLNLDFVPYRSDAQVNVFTTIAFFAYGPNNQPLHRQPIVVPVLSTDDLEQIRLNAASQQLSNLQLNMGGAFNAINAAINAATGGNATQGFAGDQLNSLTTSGPFMQNAYFVRFGARQQANGPALVPQSMLVPVVLLIPDEKSDDDVGDVGRDPGDQGLQWVSYTVMRDAKTGVPLTQDTRVMHLHIVDDDLHKFYDSRTPFEQFGDQVDIEKWFESIFVDPVNPPKSIDNTILDKIRDIQVWSFRDSLEEKDRQENNQAALNSHKYNQPPVINRIWTMLAADINEGGHFNSGNLILLANQPMQLPPTDQAITLADDGKAMTATMVGGNNLAAGKLQAKLTLTGNLPDGSNLTDAMIWAQNITVSADGHSAQLTFPSLANFGPGKADDKGKDPPPFSLKRDDSSLTLYNSKTDPKLLDSNSDEQNSKAARGLPPPSSPGADAPAPAATAATSAPQVPAPSVAASTSPSPAEDKKVKPPIEGDDYVYAKPVVYIPSKSLDAPAKPLFRLGSPMLMVDQTGKGTLSFWITKDAVPIASKAPTTENPIFLNISGADITLPGNTTPSGILTFNASMGMMQMSDAGQVSFTIQNASPASDVTISEVDKNGAAKPNPVTLRVQFQPAAAPAKST